MSRIDLSGPAPRAILAVVLVIAIGVAALWAIDRTVFPPAWRFTFARSRPVEAVNLPITTYDAPPAAKLEHPVYYSTACPTPAQKEAALPEPIRLPHPEAHPELDADPGPPAAEAAMGPREARVVFRRMMMRLDAARADAALLQAAIDQATGEGVKP